MLKTDLNLQTAGHSLSTCSGQLQQQQAQRQQQQQQQLSASSNRHSLQPSVQSIMVSNNAFYIVC